MSLSALDIVVCSIAVAASIATGLVIAIRKGVSESSSQFFLAGRRLGWPVVGASLFATNIGAEHLVGLSGDSYRYGLSAGAVELTTCICLGIACAVLFPYYIRARVYTIPEYLELRYNRTARVFFSGLMLVICIMTKLAFHLYAGALVFHSLLGWNVMPMVMLMGACVAVITIIGGFTAVAYMVHNAHANADETYSGVPLSDLLAKAGFVADKSTQQKMLRSYLRVEGTDKYWVVYSVTEVEGSEHLGDVIVATSMDGKGLGADGELKLVSTEDKKPQRWVRNLAGIAVKSAE